MSKNEPNLINKSPNPDKIKNKMEIEKKWADKILKSNPDDPESAFCDVLVKLDNPIQIWIKGQVLSNLGISCADKYLNKASQLGYCVESNIVDNAINVTKFNDGTHVFSTKDPSIVEKINNIMLESLKQEFQYDEDKMGVWSWNLFKDMESDIKVKKDEYNSDALFNMIKNDNFLKFTYHNLMSGNMKDDLDLIWDKYVKDDLNYKKLIKQYEGIVNKDAEYRSVKNEFYTRLINLLNEAKIKDKFNVSAVCDIISDFKSSRILENINDPLEKVAIKNIASDLKTKGITEKFNESNITVEKMKSYDKACYTLSKMFDIKESTSNIILNMYMIPLLDAAVKLYEKNDVEFTSLYNIMLSIVLTNEISA